MHVAVVFSPVVAWVAAHYGFAAVGGSMILLAQLMLVAAYIPGVAGCYIILVLYCMEQVRSRTLTRTH